MYTCLSVFHSLLDFVFPRRSLTGQEGDFVTLEECFALRSFPVTEEAPALRARGIFHLDAVRAGSSYHHAPLLRKAIWTFKYRRVPGIAQALTELMVQMPLPRLPPDAVLCPVPLHWSRRFQRGFNQAELLARGLSTRIGVPQRPLLLRVRPTGYQSHRNRGERLTALKGAFVCRERPAPRTVVLVDDLATTGATLDSCAAALKAAGAERVEAWVVAHG